MRRVNRGGVCCVLCMYVCKYTVYIIFILVYAYMRARMRTCRYISYTCTGSKLPNDAYR